MNAKTHEALTRLVAKIVARMFHDLGTGSSLVGVVTSSRGLDLDIILDQVLGTEVPQAYGARPVTRYDFVFNNGSYLCLQPLSKLPMGEGVGKADRFLFINVDVPRIQRDYLSTLNPDGVIYVLETLV
jgi:hypothetical protein